MILYVSDASLPPMVRRCRVHCPAAHSIGLSGLAGCVLVPAGGMLPGDPLGATGAAGAAAADAAALLWAGASSLFSALHARRALRTRAASAGVCMALQRTKDHAQASRSVWRRRFASAGT